MYQNTFSSSLSYNENKSAPWPANKLPTLKDGDALCSRIAFILERMESEQWLPYHLQEAVSNTCHDIFERFSADELTYDYAKAQIEELATTCFEHDDILLESAVLCQIRILDLEMNPKPEYMNRVNLFSQAM